MKVFDALKEMQRITREDATFSFTFMSYSLDKNESHGPRTIQHAKLLPMHDSKQFQYQYAEYLLRFRDMDTYEEKHFWLPLILNLNGEDIELS